MMDSSFAKSLPATSSTWVSIAYLYDQSLYIGCLPCLFDHNEVAREQVLNRCSSVDCGFDA